MSTGEWNQTGTVGRNIEEERSRNRRGDKQKQNIDCGNTLTCWGTTQRRVQHCRQRGRRGRRDGNRDRTGVFVQGEKSLKYGSSSYKLATIIWLSCHVHERPSETTSGLTAG